jgi:hypothetical protein
VSLTLTILAAAALALPAPQQPVQLDRFIYPLQRPLPAPPVVIDVTDAPEALAWAEAARNLTIEWYPHLTSLLATENFKSPETIKLTFKKELNVPAYASGGEITISGKWIKDHPNDLGLVIHELVHVIQQYPNFRGKPGWLVEGIADYIRWWRYEPETPRTKPGPRQNYTDSYRTTGWWLGWVSQKYDRRLVPALDRALRNRQDPMPVFQELTGKTAEELWKEFVSN